jgi:hypothetical protein
LLLKDYVVVIKPEELGFGHREIPMQVDCSCGGNERCNRCGGLGVREVSPDYGSAPYTDSDRRAREAAQIIGDADPDVRKFHLNGELYKIVKAIRTFSDETFIVYDSCG